MNTSEHILSMPLTELRERVELAERMALAARLTPTGTYAEASTGVNGSGAASDAAQPSPAAEAPKPRTRRTKEQIAADDAAKAGGGTPATDAAAGTESAMSADDMMAAMSEPAAGDAGGAELSLDDIGAGDDMMAGFEASEPTLSVAEARQKAEAIVADIIAKKDQARLTVAREALVKVGFQKAGDVTDEKIVEFYNLLPKS